MLNKTSVKMGCKHPWHTMYVDNDNGLFRLKPCCRATDVVGTADSIEEIYNHPALKKIRKQFTKGRKTPSVCVGCVDRRKESLTTPISVSYTHLTLPTILRV